MRFSVNRVDMLQSEPLYPLEQEVKSNTHCHPCNDTFEIQENSSINPFLFNGKENNSISDVTAVACYSDYRSRSGIRNDSLASAICKSSSYIIAKSVFDENPSIL